VDAALSDCRGNPAVSRAGDDTVLDDSGAKAENTLISSARMKTGNPDIVKAQLEATKSPTIHPLVRTHPETGTKAAWFHKAKTETVTGMSPEETQDFLQDLTERITQPQFCYTHEYKKGDLLTALHCIKPDSITIIASIAACIGCWRVATVPTERRRLIRRQTGNPGGHRVATAHVVLDQAIDHEGR
jgi:Taurine catabolism dioxygenase TauD, TfdA family